MDLPSCPACGQSVLDEDVAECPFCGASMLGRRSGKPKPAAAPVGPPDKAKSLLQNKPQATKAVAAPGAKQPVAPLDPDDDPFELERKTQTKAIPAVPNRVKGRSHKVVCPMCETVGYVPRPAAGRDVRCANPKCSVPVFKAPLIVEERTAHDRGDSFWSSMTGFVMISLIVIALLGGTAWFYLWRGDSASTPHDGKTATTNKGKEDSDPGATEDGQTTPETPIEPAAVEPLDVSRDDIRRDVLPMMTKASLDTAGNRSKPLCRRLAAHASAMAGESETAHEHLVALRSQRASIAYYRIPALVTVGWASLAEGKADIANGVIDEAREASKSLPQYGRDRLDVAMVLAAILVRVGLESEARDLVKRHSHEGAEGQLSAFLCSVRAAGTFDLDEIMTHGPIFPWISPQAVAVTNELAARQAWDEALAWARAVEPPEARVECVIAWATAWTDDAIDSKHPENLDRLSEVAEDIAPAARAQLFARVAFRQVRAGDTAAAEKSLERARGELAEIPVPPRLALPELKELFDFQAPEFSELRMAAAAAAEIARVEAQIRNAEAAGASLEAAMNFLRGLSPSLPSIRERLDAIASTEGRSALRDQLKAAFRLTSDDEAIRKYLDYRARLVAGEEAATKRFQLQTTLLMQAAEWGLLDPVWNTVRTRAEHGDVADREPYYDTDVPWALADAFRRKGDVDGAGKIESALTARMKARSRQQQIEHDVTALIADGNVKQAAARLSKDAVDEAWRAMRAMQIACILARGEKAEPWFDFVMGFEDARHDGLREDALDLCAALTTRLGRSRDVWTILQRSKLTQTEKNSLCHGLVAGTVAVPEDSPKEQSSSADASAPAGGSP